MNKQYKFDANNLIDEYHNDSLSKEEKKDIEKRFFENFDFYLDFLIIRTLNEILKEEGSSICQNKKIEKNQIKKNNSLIRQYFFKPKNKRKKEIIK